MLLFFNQKLNFKIRDCKYVGKYPKIIPIYLYKIYHDFDTFSVFLYSLKLKFTVFWKFTVDVSFVWIKLS